MRGKVSDIRWALVLVLALLLATNAVHAAAPREVTIALVAPLTGSQADVGEFNRNAVEMAVEDVNRAGGVAGLGGARLKLVVVDVTSEASGAVSAVNRLLSTQEVTAAVGLGISPLTIPVQPIFERHQVPFLVHAIADAITSQGYRYTFQIAPKGSMFGQMQVDFLQYLNQRYRLGLKRAAVVYENSAYGTSTATGIKDIAAKAGLDLALYQSYPHGITDASFIVTAIRNSGAQVLFPVGYTTDAQLIINTMAVMQVRPLIIGGGAGFIWPVMGKALGDRINGLFSVASWNWDSKNIMDKPELREIVLRYKERYGSFMPEHSGMAYGEVWAVVAAINKAGTADPRAVRDALASLEFTSGPVTLMQPGRVRFNENGFNQFAHPVIIQWQEGEPRTVYPPEDASREIVGL